jgi:hypothetical protein
MTSIRSYVVRIYRSGRTGITGVVEDVRTGRSRPFSSVTELWDALRPGSPRATASRPPVPTPAPPGHRCDRSSD